MTNHPEDCKAPDVTEDLVTYQRRTSYGRRSFKKAVRMQGVSESCRTGRHMKFLHPSISLDDLEVNGPGMPATWTNETAERHGSSERVPAIVVSVLRRGDDDLFVTSREERNGSERKFHVSLRDDADEFSSNLRCGAFTLFIGERPVAVECPPVVVAKAPERRVGAGVALILTNAKGEVLMGKRKGSHGAGTYSFIGGWMDHGESFLDTAVREAKEEADLDVRRATVVYAMSTVFPEEGKHSVTVLLAVHPKDWSGIPKAMEPNKLDGEWGWYHPHNLPSPLFKPLADLGEALTALLS